MMNNNTVNEISTNVSPTQSPSKNLRLRWPVDQKNTFSNFASFLPSLNIDSINKTNFSQKSIKLKEIEEKKEENEKPKIKRRIIKKIIKKKIGEKHHLLDFDFILKELFNKNNLKKNINMTQFREIVNKKNLMKKRKKAIKKFIAPLNNVENGKNLLIIFNLLLLL